MAYPRKHKYVIGPDDGRLEMLPGFGGVRFMLEGDETGGLVSIVEHPVEPRGMSARHTHSKEDEYTFVIDGKIGFEIGGEEFVVGPGALVLKPRGVPHVFWNPTDKPAKVLEIIAAAGLEKFFEEMMALRESGSPPSPDKMAPLWQKYGISMDFASTFELARKHGLQSMPLPAGVELPK